jgi:heme exporter protein B
MLQQLKTLIKKEITLEWRQKYALNGILLYVISAVFLTYLSFGARDGNISPPTWNSLYWIIILFSAVNAVAKSFVQEHQGRQLYYYMVASPESIILSKMIYNALLTLLLALLGYLVFSVILGNPIANQGLFLINLALGALGFSACLTMVSGIASKASNNATLMAILSFPVVIPILLMAIRVSKNAMDGLDWSTSWDKVLTLVAINAIVTVTAYLLFPYVWRS